jgi:hypothetical protein
MVTSDVKDSAGNELISAYAVERPDGLWRDGCAEFATELGSSAGG